MAFGAGRGVTQGKPKLLMIFNVVMDVVVREVLKVVCGPYEAQHRMGLAAVERILVLCVDDGQIVGRDYIWVQDSLTLFFQISQKNHPHTRLHTYAKTYQKLHGKISTSHQMTNRPAN